MLARRYSFDFRELIQALLPSLPAVCPAGAASAEDLTLAAGPTFLFGLSSPKANSARVSHTNPIQ